MCICFVKMYITVLPEILAIPIHKLRGSSKGTFALICNEIFQKVCTQVFKIRFSHLIILCVHLFSPTECKVWHQNYTRN